MPGIDQMLFSAQVKLVLTYDGKKFHPVTSEPPPADALTIAYRPSFWNLEYEVAVADAADGGALQAIRRAQHMLAKWDLTDAKGKVIPFTDDALAKVPTRFLNMLYVAVVEDMNPDPQSSGS